MIRPRATTQQTMASPCPFFEVEGLAFFRERIDMKKRWTAAAVLAALLLLSLFGCGGSGVTPSEGQPAPPPETASTGSVPEEPPAEAHDPADFRMKQESSVRNEKFREQEEFGEFLGLAESCYLIPGLNEAMTPQGISWSEKTGLAYVTSYSMLDTISSAISAVDPKTGEFAAEYYLFNPDGTPFTSHVGGIAVVGERVYVSAKLDNDGSYSIADIPLSDLPLSGSHNVTVKRTIPLPVSPSFLNYSQGVLWVGNFYHPKGDYNLSTGMKFTTPSADGDYGCYILGYATDGGEIGISEGQTYPIPSLVLVAPDRIQGVVKVGDTVWLSQSYGRTANSTLLAYEITGQGKDGLTVPVDGVDVTAYLLDSKNQTAAVTAMPMTEGLCLGPDGSILVLFESGSSRYKDGKYRTDYVWKMTP